MPVMVKVADWTVEAASPSGLGAAEGKLVVAGDYGASSLFIDLREGAGIEGEGDVPGFAGIEMEALEAGEGLLRERGRIAGE